MQSTDRARVSGDAAVPDLDGFRERLKHALEARGMSARELERRLDLSKGTLTRVYAGRRALQGSELEAIAAVLGIDAGDLVGDPTGRPGSEGGEPEPVEAEHAGEPAADPGSPAAEVSPAPSTPQRPPTPPPTPPSPPTSARPAPGPRPRSGGARESLARKLVGFPRRVLSAVVEVVSGLLGRG